MKGPSPLLGYNTNVRHRGKLFHIQTEDSGVKHPHIITHLFADGGRIVASQKSSYAEHIGAPDLRDVVKKMMREQHKGMFIALRDGVYDEDGAPTKPTQDVPPPAAAAPSNAPLVSAAQAAPNHAEVDALERAAARLSSQSNVAVGARRAAGRFQSTKPAHIAGISSRPPGSIFGSDLLSEKSLDEVILSYLAEDLEEDGV